MTPQHLISFQCLYDQPITFLAMPIPSKNTPDWVKMSGVHPGKRPHAWEQNRAIFWRLVYPKCSKLEVYNPQVMILDILSIIYQSNDPQVFHLQKKLRGLQIIHALGLFSRVHPEWYTVMLYIIFYGFTGFWIKNFAFEYFFLMSCNIATCMVAMEMICVNFCPMRKPLLRMQTICFHWCYAGILTLNMNIHVDK